MKKIFFFDIDDTLLPSGGKISPENIRALKKLQEHNDVYIATGKSIGMCKDVAKTLGVKNIITSNGNVITENEKIVYNRTLKEEDINEIRNLIKDKKELILGGQGNDKTYVLSSDKDFYEKYVRNIFTNLKVNLPIPSENFKEEIYQMWLLGDVEAVNVNEQKYDTFRWNKYGLDIVYKGTSKAQAIKFLLNSKYKDEEVITYAFGDSLNDIEMFKTVDHAIAVSNAKEELKKYAEEVTDNSQNKGVYNYLKENNLL